MFTGTFALSALAALGCTHGSMAAMSVIGDAIVTIETSHGGAGSDLTNATIQVPLTGLPYVNQTALNAVSTLYLTGAIDAPLENIVCIPWKAFDGTGTGGLPFTSSQPSRLSTNTVVVGSITCTTATD
ncbi:hypothetical protein GQ53DRAFT_841450 [Thozetella sp. PMI_491]|nr:hypothetical protein GQ53DRAFT_841450 [Thozetella sp. PMI_491]